MKSREYRNVQNNAVYWLEDGAVMVKHPKTGEILRQAYSAESFFVMVGNDMLELIEQQHELLKHNGVALLQLPHRNKRGLTK